MKRIITIITLLCALPVLARAQTNEVTIDLIWEADTYTPAFYGGHTQIAPGSLVKVVALPVVSNASAINNVQVNNFQFDWTKDHKQVSSASGIGQNILLYKAGTSGSNTVSVAISTPAGESIASKQLTLPIEKPKLIFYREDPLIGTEFREALNSKYTLNKPEITLRAMPLFFSSADVANKRLTFNWLMGKNKIVTDQNDQQLATFVTPTEGSGANQIEVSAESQTNIFQTAKNNLSITFNQNGNIF